MAHRAVKDPTSQIEATSHFPTPADRVNSPFAIIPTSIALVGNVDGILDSVAGYSIIREDLIRNLPIEDPHIVENLVTFDRHRVSTRGFVRLTVRFKESVVELKRVRVVPDCIHEMILGIDWLYATGANLQFTPRGPVVTLPSSSEYLCAGSTLGERPTGILRGTVTDRREGASNYEAIPRHVHFSDSVENDSMSISLIQPEPRLIDQVLAGLSWTQTLAYLDGLMVHGPNFQEHLRRLETVSSTLAQAGLRLNPEKCSFGVSSITYLGHEIDHKGIRPDPKKMTAMQHFPVPTDLCSLRGFLGLVSF